MKRVVPILLLLCAGCATAPMTSQQCPVDYDYLSDKPTDTNVVVAIRKMLDAGQPVAVMVDCTVSCTGIPEGRVPEEYGCTNDETTAADIEKFLLLDALGAYPHFTIVDRSKIDTSIKEINLGMNGTTSDALQPGQARSATHLLSIESRDILTRCKGKIQDRYIAIKKLMDLQKNVIVAMDKIDGQREAVYQPLVAAQGLPTGAAREEPQPKARGTLILPDIPEDEIEDDYVLPDEPALQPAERITLYGVPQPPKPKYPGTANTPYRADNTPDYGSKTTTSFTNAYDGAAATRTDDERRATYQAQARYAEARSSRYIYSQPYNQAQAAAVATIIKQRFPTYSTRDNKSIMQQIYQRPASRAR